MRTILSITIIFFFVFGIKAQSICDIKITIQNYNHDTLTLGGFIGGDRLPIELIKRSKEGNFSISNAKKLPEGMYYIQLLPDNRYFEFVVDADQQFSISTNFDKIYEELSCIGSVENELYFKCLKLINEKRQEANELNSKINLFQSRDPILAKEAKDKLKLLNNLVIQEQLYFLNNAPKSLTKKYILSSKEPEPEEYNSNDPVQVNKAENYVKLHFLDNIDFTDERIMRSPYPYNQIQALLINNINHPDSLISAIDIVMSKILGSINTNKVYFEFCMKLISSPRPKYLENALVHVVRNYIQKGKINWIQKSDSLSFVTNIDKIEPLLLGRTAPDFVMTNKNGEHERALLSDSLVKVLYFGEYNCAPCQPVLMGLLDFYDIYKFKHVEVIGVCSNTGEACKKCFQYAEANLVQFRFLADPEKGLDVLKQYNINSTPAIFVLNKNNQILAKNIGLQELYKVVNKEIISNSKL